MIVDVRGNPVSRKQVTGSGLVKAQEWVAYLDHYAHTFASGQPYMIFVLHAVVNFQQGFVIMSRRLRKNAHWTGGGTMAEDTIGLVEDAETRLAWFEKHSEEIDEAQLPDEVKFLLCAVQGGLRTQVRIARECEQVIRKGHLLLPVTTRGELLPGEHESIVEERSA
jgi:hypothetical protein